MRKWIELNLRGVSQVMLQNNSLTGLFFLMGIFWAAYAAGAIQIAFGSLCGLIVANITAVLLKADRKNLDQGLYGYNAVLIGIAILTFLKPEPLSWILLILASMASACFMWIILEKQKTIKIPALTFPFVLIAWVILFILLQVMPDLFNNPSAVVSTATFKTEIYLSGVFKSLSEVFLLDSYITGGLFVLGLAVSSVAAAGFSILGALIALGVATVMRTDPHSIEAGLCGFNAVLTAIALGCVFFEASIKSVVYVIIGVGVAIAIQGALAVVCANIGLPVLTAPFVFATWIVLELAKRLKLVESLA